MYKIPDKIMILTNNDEYVFLNCEDVYPVYFPTGGDFMYDLLKRLKQIEPFTEIPVDQNAEEILDFLLKNKLAVPAFISDDSVLERQKTCSCENSPGRMSPGKSVYLQLTQSCNQSCIYCLNGKESYQVDENLKMPFDISVQSINSAIESILPSGKMELVFFGGEPLMNWSLAKEIIHYCETELKGRHFDKKIHYHLTTNLTLFPSDLIEYAQKYSITFLVNVDGSEEIHNRTRPFITGKGSYRTTVRNVKRLIDSGLNVSLRSTITSINQDRMLEIAQVHKDMGGESTAFVPLNPVDSDNKLFPFELFPDPVIFSKGLVDVYQSGIWDKDKIFPFNEYSSHLQPGYKNQYGCGAPHGNTPVITTEGKMYSCIYLVGNERYEIGDIRRNDFPRTEVLQNMMNISNLENRNDCRECSYKNLCGGGCPVGLFSITDNPDSPEYLRKYISELTCVYSKTIINTLLWDLALKQKTRLEEMAVQAMHF